MLYKGISGDNVTFGYVLTQLPPVIAEFTEHARGVAPPQVEVHNNKLPVEGRGTALNPIASDPDHGVIPASLYAALTV